MTKLELLEKLKNYSDDDLVQIYLRDHYRGFASADIVYVKAWSHTCLLRIVVDLDKGINNSGDLGYLKIIFRK